MINPKEMPTIRILPDGRKIPTNKGLVYTEEELTMKSEILKGRPKAKEGVEKRSTVWSIVKPFYARGALVREISEITDLGNIQVENAIKRNKNRPEWSRVEPFTLTNKTNERTARARNLSEDRKGFMPHYERKSIAFAKEIAKQKLFGEDISSWIELHNLNKNLPGSFSKRLRLELFLIAIKQAVTGDSSLLEKYNQIGNSVDPKWFAGTLKDEEKFIRIKVENPWADGEDPKGLYSERNGDRLYRYVYDGSDNGAFDNSILARGRRRQIREKNLVPAGK